MSGQLRTTALEGAVPISLQGKASPVLIDYGAKCWLSCPRLRRSLTPDNFCSSLLHCSASVVLPGVLFPAKGAGYPNDPLGKCSAEAQGALGSSGAPSARCWADRWRMKPTCAHAWGESLLFSFFFFLRTKPQNNNLPRFGKMALIPCLSLEHFYGPFQAGM